MHFGSVDAWAIHTKIGPKRVKARCRCIRRDGNEMIYCDRETFDRFKENKHALQNRRSVVHIARTAPVEELYRYFICGNPCPQIRYIHSKSKYHD